MVNFDSPVNLALQFVEGFKVRLASEGQERNAIEILVVVQCGGGDVEAQILLVGVIENNTSVVFEQLAGLSTQNR